MTRLLWITSLPGMVHEVLSVFDSCIDTDATLNTQEISSTIPIHVRDWENSSCQFSTSHHSRYGSFKETTVHYLLFFFLYVWQMNSFVCRANWLRLTYIVPSMKFSSLICYLATSHFAIDTKALIKFLLIIFIEIVGLNFS